MEKSTVGDAAAVIVDSVMDSLEKKAAETETKIDDVAVDIARAVLLAILRIFL